MKNRKKREAAAKGRQDKPGGTVPSAVVANVNASAGGGGSKALDLVNSDAETQKKLKNIMKKLEQINVLKHKLETGEKLEANQVSIGNGQAGMKILVTAVGRARFGA